MRHYLFILVKLVISLVIIAVLGLGVLYIQTTIYHFPPPIPFSGDSLINPYQSIDSKRLKCNFHAHSMAWFGITNGADQPQDIQRAYKEQGYSVAGVSNYHCIEKNIYGDSPIYIPVYEHGINIFKSHELSIGSDKVSYFDYPLWQNTSQKQQIINDIRNNEGVVVIAHPKFMDGHTLEDMSQLTNYQLVEVLNHYRISDEYWDAALTAGRLVYGIGNDDTHDIDNEPTFKMWTEVYADTASAEGVVNALKQGKSYMVYAEGGTCNTKVVSVNIVKNEITIALQGDVEFIDAWGAGHKPIGGSELLKDVNNTNKTFTINLPKNEPYVRFVARCPSGTLYLNPIVRSKDGKTAGIGNAQPTVNQMVTWLYRLVVLLILGVVIALFLYIWRIKPFKR